MLKWLSEDCVTRGDIRGVAPLDRKEISNVLLNSRLSYYDPPAYWIEFEKKSGEVGRWDYGGDSKRAIAHYLELRDKWGDGMIENTVKSRGFCCAA